METLRSSGMNFAQAKEYLVLTRVPDHCEVCQVKNEQLWLSHETDEYLCENCALDTEL